MGRRGLRRHHSNVGVVGQLLGPPARPFRQVALGHRLQPPGDLSDKVRTMPGANRLAKQLGVTLAELSGGHPFERRHLAINIKLHHKPLWFSSYVNHRYNETH